MSDIAYYLTEGKTFVLDLENGPVTFRVDQILYNYYQYREIGLEEDDFKTLFKTLFEEICANNLGADLPAKYVRLEMETGPLSQDFLQIDIAVFPKMETEDPPF